MSGRPIIPKQTDRVALEAWFWSHVEKTDTCWLWTGKTNDAGYGTIAKFGVRSGAHRVALALSNHRIDSQLWALHKCNNPPCVRVGPGHVYGGTPNENWRDRRDTGAPNKICRLREPKLGFGDLFTPGVRDLARWLERNQFSRLLFYRLLHTSGAAVGWVAFNAWFSGHACIHWKETGIIWGLTGVHPDRFALTIKQRARASRHCADPVWPPSAAEGLSAEVSDASLLTDIANREQRRATHAALPKPSRKRAA